VHRDPARRQSGDEVAVGFEKVELTQPRQRLPANVGEVAPIAKLADVGGKGEEADLDRLERPVAMPRVPERLTDRRLDAELLAKLAP
jgi:hypothetical protein